MAKNFEIVRTYAKRETEKSEWFGRIGSATLALASKSDIEVTLDGKPLGANAINHLLNFAMQTLQDAYAGAASLDEAKGRFEKKRDAILNGTIGVRGEGSGGESEETRVARKIIGEHLRRAGKWDSFESLETSERNEKLDALVAKNREKIAGEIAKEIERLRELRAAKAKRMEISLDL